MAVYDQLAQSVAFEDQAITTHSEELIPIGHGRSAAVFKIKGEAKAIKIFYPEFTHIAVEEAVVYEKLVGIPYYPAFYEAGEGYLVIEYIEGETIFDCLVKGIVLTERLLIEVDRAIEMARERGLCPSDIHLRNILLTPDGEIRLIDVARFGNEKDDRQWEDLKRAFYTLYQKPFFPKTLPAPLIDAIGRWYVEGGYRYFDKWKRRHNLG